MARFIIILLIIIIILTVIKSVVTKFFPDRNMKIPKVKGNKTDSGHSGSDRDKIVDAKYEEIK